MSKMSDFILAIEVNLPVSSYPLLFDFADTVRYMTLGLGVVIKGW
jgi:hypothetical protein